MVLTDRQKTVIAQRSYQFLVDREMDSLRAYSEIYTELVWAVAMVETLNAFLLGTDAHNPVTELVLGYKKRFHLPTEIVKRPEENENAEDN